MTDKETLEIRFHSRGGQGGATAAKLLGLAAFLEGKLSSASPLYGPERRGAPVVAFTRIGRAALRLYHQVVHPDIVVVLDPSLASLVDITVGLEPSGLIIINSPESDLPQYRQYRVLAIDLTQIALENDLVLGGNPILNTPILGVFARIGLVKLESVEEAIRRTVAQSATGDKNVAAARMAFECSAEPAFAAMEGR